MNLGGAPPEFFRLVYVDGVAAPVRDPTPRDDGLVVLYKREDFAATRAARQRDHSRRVRRHARELLPDVAGTVLTEEDLVNLMDGDVDDFGGIVLQGPLGQGTYVNYVPT